MASLADNYMRYAHAGAVLTVLRKLREAGLPDLIDNSSITRIGVTKGNAGRTVAALKFIGVIDADGKKTEIHDRLARAKTGEYPENC